MYVCTVYVFSIVFSKSLEKLPVLLILYLLLNLAVDRHLHNFISHIYTELYREVN